MAKAFKRGNKFVFNGDKEVNTIVDLNWHGGEFKLIYTNHAGFRKIKWIKSLDELNHA